MPDSDNIQEILSHYDAKRPLYEDFRRVCENLISQILQAENVSIHTVESRVKSRESLAGKLQRPLKTYSSLSEVTDLVGVRVITYFDDDVDEVASILKREFQVDEERSVDKRRNLEPSTFGYLSLHQIASLNTSRHALPEYRRFKNSVCEIQIRSILQHAWAEIEHDLGYKASSKLPDAIRRRFSRLAGSLEMVDNEFRGIRDDLKAYRAQADSMLDQTHSELQVDDVTLAALVNRDGKVQEISKSIASASGAVLIEPQGTYGNLATGMRSLGLTTIESVKEALAQHSALVQEFAPLQITGRGYFQLGKGIALAQLYLLMVAERADGDEGSVAKHFEEAGFFFPEDRLAEAKRVVTNLSRAKRALGI